MHQLPRLIAAIALSASALTVTSAHAAPSAAPDGGGQTTLTLAPANRVMAVTANVEEVYTGSDNHNDRDRINFVHRLKFVLSTRKAKGDPDVYIPDVIFLQEVRAKTGTRIAQLLSEEFGHPYVFAVNPGPDENGRVPGHSHPYLERETGVLYDTDTMHKVAASHQLEFAVYLRNWIRKRDNWTTRSSYLSALQKNGGATYVVGSIHTLDKYQVNNRYLPNDQARWIDEIKTEIHAHYAGDRVLIGGDFNTYMCEGNAVYTNAHGCPPGVHTTPMGAAVSGDGTHWRSALGDGVDHIFSTQTFVGGDSINDEDASLIDENAMRKDVSYRLYSESSAHFLNGADFAGRFGSGPVLPTKADAFTYCNEHYNGGDEGTFALKHHRTEDGYVHTEPPIEEVPGCEHRMYSDHAFDWAVG